MNLLHLKTLGLGSDASLEDVKKAYRRLVRENHPDLFQGEKKLERELRMMRLNEAYQQLTRPPQLVPEEHAGANPNGPGASGADKDGRNPDGENRVPGWDYELHGRDPVLSKDTSMGGHKDPSYAYYKQGFIHYSRGAGGMMLKGRRGKLTPDEKGLERARESLEAFQAAHGYFRRVVEEYPDSVWFADASYKLHRIERFTLVYRRIRGNISARVEGRRARREEAG